MRLLRTSLREFEVRPKLRELVDALFAAVPSGVGATGLVHLSDAEFRDVMREGARWCVGRGYGWADDLDATEGGGCLPGADPDQVSHRAVARGRDQLGTLGSGNHYLEVQVVPPGGIHDARVARAFGIETPGQVLIMLHCGSRGFGHQIGTDYLRKFDQVMPTYGISVRDRELACAPFRSAEGQAYFGAMNAAANTAFANRQVITHRVREVMGRVFGRNPRELGLSVVYDVCHNTAKLERHVVGGESIELVVHRKGATRSFGPGAADLPEAYAGVGQPVIIGGSMETGSALLVGTAHAMEETFGSTAHGAGRAMSRAQAKRRVRGDVLMKEMEERGIVVRAASRSGVAEEAAFAYKDLDEVVDVVHRLDIARKVVSLRPIGNIKG
jgi:tRNA-splicing ligase RtcB